MQQFRECAKPLSSEVAQLLAMHGLHGFVEAVEQF
jgi:hypothetical protein